jgi:hypothetical protein
MGAPVAAFALAATGKAKTPATIDAMATGTSNCLIGFINFLPVEDT